MNGALPPGYINPAQADALGMQRQDLLAQQAAARQRGPPQGQQFDTWGGGVLGGVGDTLRAFSDKSKEMQLAQAIAENTKQRQAMFGGGGGPPMVGP